MGCLQHELSPSPSLRPAPRPAPRQLRETPALNVRVVVVGGHVRVSPALDDFEGYICTVLDRSALTRQGDAGEVYYFVWLCC